MSRKKWVVLAILLVVGWLALSALFSGGGGSSSASTCRLSQSTVDGLMADYLRAHAAGNVESMAAARGQLERYTQCSSPAYSAVLGWTRAVLAGDQASMTTHDEYLLQAIRESQR